MPAAGVPYEGTKTHWILDIENADLATDMCRALARALPLHKPKKQTPKQLKMPVWTAFGLRIIC